MKMIELSLNNCSFSYLSNTKGHLQRFFIKNLKLAYYESTIVVHDVGKLCGFKFFLH